MNYKSLCVLAFCLFSFSSAAAVPANIQQKRDFDFSTSKGISGELGPLYGAASKGFGFDVTDDSASATGYKKIEGGIAGIVDAAAGIAGVISVSH